MFLLRLLHAVHENAAEEIAAHAVPPREHAPGHLAEHRQPGQRADREMKPRVHGRPLRVAPGRDGSIHLRDEPLERLDLPRDGALGDDARRNHLEAFEDGEHVLDRFR
jgi:hypothetical protein